MNTPRTTDDVPASRRVGARGSNGAPGPNGHASVAVAHAVSPLPASPFERVFSIGRQHAFAVFIGAFLFASVVHGSVGVALVRKKANDDQAATEIIDVDITEPEPKKEEPPKEEPIPEATPEPIPTAPVAMSPKAPDEAKPDDKPPPPPLAGAGNLLTANDENSQNSEDVPEFVTDPNGKEYVGGNTVVGGGDQVGKPGGVASGVPCGGPGQPPCGTGTAAKGPLAAPPPPPPKPAVDLSRPPSVPSPNLCKNYFPADADDDSAYVQVLVTVDASGKVTNATVLVEDPKGQGFGRQARTCLLSSKLNPALDVSGQPVTKSTPIGVRFTRY